MPDIHATIQDRDTLDLTIRDEMYALFARYYDDTSRRMFDADLDAKQSVVLVREADNRLCGFSTLVSFQFQFEGRATKVVYSGDTIIEREHWGSQAFAFSWIRHIGKLARQTPKVPLYWLLIVKGHRTYRYLPAFGLRFVPDWRAPQDSALIRFRNAVATSRFGEAYNPATGIVSYPKPQSRLAKPFADVTERERSRADVRFFLETNPGYRKGDELVCLCELAPSNMRPMTRRLFEDGSRT
jgi:hypothetical protein